MNKHYKMLLFAATMIVSTSLHAQPTLTQGNCAPQVGNTFTTHNVAYAAPGSGGANATWDFSGLVSGGTSTYSWVDPSTTPNGTDFSGATVSYESSPNNFVYVQTSSSKYETKGIDNNGIIINYNDPETILEFPLTYSDTWSDNLASTYVSGGYTFYRSGSNIGVADGYGTLILPYGTFNNVLRVTVTSDFIDEYNPGIPLFVEYDVVNTYWYLPGINNPLLQMSSFSSSTGGAPTITQYGYYIDQLHVGVEGYTPHELFHMQVFPNPATTTANVRYALKDGGNVRISLYNTLGQEVQTMVNQTQSTGDYTTTINVNDLKKGIYLIRMEVGGQAQTEKLTVQ